MSWPAWKGRAVSSSLVAREYAMRVWLAPGKPACSQSMPSDVTAALRASKTCRWQPGRSGSGRRGMGLDFQYAVNARGRLLDPDESGR